MKGSENVCAWAVRRYILHDWVSADWYFHINSPSCPVDASSLLDLMIKEKCCCRAHQPPPLPGPTTSQFPVAIYAYMHIQGLMLSVRLERLALICGKNSVLSETFCQKCAHSSAPTFFIISFAGEATSVLRGNHGSWRTGQCPVLAVILLNKHIGGGFELTSTLTLDWPFRRPP